MSRVSKFIVLALLATSISFAASVDVTTYYGKTGGIVGKLNKTTDKINGKEICQNNPTPGCDFDDDPKFDNHNTVDDPTDDTYSGDLLVRTNDNFQAIAGWTWNGTPGGAEEVATITGTLPTTNGKTYYEWTQLPGSCNPDNSSISPDKQTIVCERKDFDKNDAGTFSEDLTFNVRVRGGTPSGTQPGEIKFKVEAPNAPIKEDTTDGNSLTVTASPRWNLDKTFGAYSTRSGQKVTINGTEKTGWIIDYRILIETDEVNGEIDNTYSLLGNESLGDDATITFTDDISNVSPNAMLLDCRTTGRAYSDGNLRDGYDGSNLPITFSGPGSIKENQKDSHIPQAKGVQTPTCTQNGSSIDVKIEHVDATLNHYPTRDYYNRKLPVNRAIASMLTMSIFIPLDDVKAGDNGTIDCNGYGIGRNDCDDGELHTNNIAKDFNPISASGGQNFAGKGESERDNNRPYTLYYSAGSFDKYYWGDKNSIWNGPAGITTSRQGDAFVGKGYEWSSRLYAGNSGGINQDTNSFCDVIDANYMEIIKYKERTNYTDTRYSHEDDLPFILYTSIGKGDTDNHMWSGGKISDYYDIEFAGDYEDSSFLPSTSNNNDRQDNDVRDKIKAECNASDAKWYATMDEARAAQGGTGAVTKVRWKLKPGKVMVPGQGEYWMLFHRVRENRLDNNQALQSGTMMVNYGVHKFDGNEGKWSNTNYIPKGLDANRIPENTSGAYGDRIFFTGPKVRIKKHESRESATPGDEVTYTLEMSLTDDVGSNGLMENVTITDVLPKDFKYKQGSTIPIDFGDPTIGTCADVSDIVSAASPCVDVENQVLIWDLGEKGVNKDIPDLNYTALIGAAANVGTNTNAVKIYAPTDASPVSQRKAEIGLSIDVPSSINIVKNTEENPAYPSKRERTTTSKDIFFLMDMRNGRNGDVTDLDVIDILPFKGDGDDEAIMFNDLKLKRKVPTDYQGTMKFHEASFGQHPGSSTECDYSGKLHYYYTHTDPKTINMAPTVGEANDVNSNKSIWCEGDANGPNGCTILVDNFTFTDNAQVTAVRARGPRMEKQAICQFRVHVSVRNNLKGDNYSNSAGASATGITLPVLSNSLAVPIVGSSLGDFVWYDKDKNGIQDAGEAAIPGVKVHLLDDAGNPVKDPTSGQDYVVTTDANGKYLFDNLNHGGYQVRFDLPDGYIVSPQNQGADGALDSDAAKDAGNTATTAVTPLRVAEDYLHLDLGLYTPVISGHIFDDGDGNGNVNGNPINKPDGKQLYATLLANDGTVLATTPIADDGTYSFDGEDGVRADSNYSVVLSTAENATTSDLPLNWNNTGQQPNNTGTNGNDGANNGILDVQVRTNDMPNNDFGINKKPEAFDKNEPAQINLPAGQQATVPTLEGNDSEDGPFTPTKIKITELPNQSQGVLYYDGHLVAAGEVIDNYIPARLTVDPANHVDGQPDPTVVFKYTVYDRDGVESDPATVTMPFTAPRISGNLFDDGNGDGNINGTPISKPSDTQLYVTLIDKDSGAVVASKPLASDGTYFFDVNDGVVFDKNYTLVLSDALNKITPALPADWNNADGENVNSILPTGNDGQVNGAGDGKIDIVGPTMGNVDIPLIDFGINHKPTAEDKTKPPVLNPGGTTQAIVPPLDIHDDEDGTPPTITIVSLPDNAKLYYDGVEITAADLNKTITDYNASKLTVDPIDGEQNVSFDYTTTDKAGVESNPATVTLPFTGVTLSGHVFADGSGDGNISGTGINKPDGIQLYAILLDVDGNVMASTLIANHGTYEFTGADGVTANTEYSIVLSMTNAAQGDPAPTPKLPIDWNNADGEQPNNTGNGNDGQVNGVGDGKITLTTGNTTTNPNNDFGINHKPVANDETKPAVLNPGGNTQVTVPPLDYADDEDGTPSTITIKTLPNNATLYYEGQPVVAGTPIPNFNPSKLTVDPIDGDQTVVFTYTTTDAAGVESDPATVTMPFDGLGISGTLFDDGNGDGNVNGNPINKPDGQQLYVNLVDANGNVLAAKPLADDGTYQFLGAEGVTANTDYTIVLSTTEGTPGDPAPAPNLPANWNNTGENINSAGTGDDGTADGIIAVSLGTTGIPQIDFGINHKPVANDKTENTQPNPSGDKQYPVPTLPVTDTEDGTPATITIKTLPDPATGVLYYDGQPVTADQVIPNFDPSKLTVDPTDGNQVMVFTYTTTDAAGVESDPATVTMPFLGEMHLGDTVWMDDNSNGVQDSGENGVAGVKVTLLDEKGNVVNTVTTDSNGKYEFIIKKPGKYRVTFDDGYYYTKKCATCTEDKDSNVQGLNNTTDLIELDWGDSDMTIDAGITPTAHIGDYFWIDADKNGMQDADEDPVVNALVELLDENGNPVLDQDGNPIVAHTDKNGKYGFDVPAGKKYLVRFTIPQKYIDDGYVFTGSNVGADGKDSDVSGNGVIMVPVHAKAGNNYLTLDAGINCGCDGIDSDSSDAMGGIMGILMLIFSLGMGLLMIRREEAVA